MRLSFFTYSLSFRNGDFVVIFISSVVRMLAGIGASSRAITRARRDNEYDGEGSSSNRAEAPPNGSPSCDAESFYI